MTSKMLEMWPMFALFKYEMLSRRGKGLVLRPLLDKLCITLYLFVCRQTVPHGCSALSPAACVSLYGMIYNVHTKYRMSGTIRFVLLMQHKGIVLLLSTLSR